MKNEDKKVQYYSIKDLMEIAGVSRQTIYNWFDKGLKSFKIGKSVRIKREDFESFMEQHRRN